MTVKRRILRADFLVLGITIYIMVIMTIGHPLSLHRVSLLVAHRVWYRDTRVA